MPKFRKRPLVVEAEQWFPGKRVPGVILACDKEAPTNVDDEHGHRMPFVGGKEDCPIAVVKTIHGYRIVREGEWIIAETDGLNFYPCRAEIFDVTYEPAD
jgi:hypothetical protein